MMPSLAKSFTSGRPTSPQIAEEKTVALINPTYDNIIFRFNSLRKIKLFPIINLLLERMVVSYVL